ncbi:MAG: UbiA-like protein EboC [Lunatimonas sp.]|uniref:UbiA-like protein EboC n=1 Tax=Lunatimonas sp. TaxID=2060141 RepID=UPI00263BCD2A|nr:UbiA-like protein EboC [Lunatimonas sp.]MCC5937845.1 UbiA-like protein EboC [Lunatimonas sp.]
MGNLLAHIRLTRPANIVTAIADIWAGFAISGVVAALISGDLSVYLGDMVWLTIATIGLYGGGVAFNDVFDAELDRVERPERPIPSGQISVWSAGLMAAGLLLLGIIAALQVGVWSGEIAVFIAVFAVIYDAWGKHQQIFGPINMGLCRGANLLLGVSLIPESIGPHWYLALIPIAYISAITMISRGEVHGKNRSALLGGLWIYFAIFAALLAISVKQQGYGFWQVVPFIGLFAYLILPPLWKAIATQEPKHIGKAVKAGVLSLIVMNACFAAAFAGWWVALIILALLPLSRWLAKRFAVT